jgi:hypothetical protein
MMNPHPPRGRSHHTTHDPIIEVHGDTAMLDAHFVVFDVVGAEKPQGGWPEGASGAQGTITPIESGYYRPILKKVDGRWIIRTTASITIFLWPSRRRDIAMTDTQVWLITGSSRGLGRALSEAVLDAGHSLVATARNPGNSTISSSASVIAFGPLSST